MDDTQGGPKIKTLTLDDLQATDDRHGIIQQAADDYGPPLDLPENMIGVVDETGVVVDQVAGYFDVWWGGYDYNSEFSRIDTLEKAFSWLHHIGEKTWEGTTPARMLALLDKCATQFGWNRHLDC